MVGGAFYRLGVVRYRVLGYDLGMMQEVTQVGKKIDAANRSQLARELGLTRPHVSQVLSGRSVPSLVVAAGIAKRVGVTLDELWDHLQTASVN